MNRDARAMRGLGITGTPPVYQFWWGRKHIQAIENHLYRLMNYGAIFAYTTDTIP